MIAQQLRIALFLAGFMLLMPSAGFPGWEWSKTPVNLSAAGSSARIPRVSSNGAGQAFGIWPYQIDNRWVIQSSPFANGQWQLTPLQVSPSGQDGGLPQIAVAANGSARAVWVQAGALGVVKSAFLDVSQSPQVWSSPVTVSNATRDAASPQVALDSKGNAQLVYTQNSGSGFQVVVRPLVNGELLPPQVISQVTADAALPQIVMLPNGAFVVVWTSSSVQGQSSVLAVQSLAGVFGPVEVLSATTSQGLLPAITVDPEGLVTVVWMEVVGQTSRIFSRQLLNGRWEARKPLSPANLNVNFPHIASTAQGQAIAAWIQQSSGGNPVVRTRAVSNGLWAPAVDHAVKESALLARIAGRSNGNATLVWLSQSATATTVNGSFFNGSVWTAPEALGKGGTEAVFPDVSMPTDTMAQVLWLGVNAGIDQVQALAGNYTPTPYTLTVKKSGQGSVTSMPQGIDCGSSCSASFIEGTLVTLSPETAPGQNFIQWGGACQGSGSCQLRIGAATTVTAKFVDSTDYSLKVARPSGGQIKSQPEGIECGLGSRACRFAFGKDARVTLFALPKEGYALTRWRGCPAPQGSSCDVLVDQPLVAVTAAFKPKPKALLSVKKSRDGSVTSDPGGLRCGEKTKSCGARFEVGSRVTLSAVPAQGSSFAGWGGACQGQDPICLVTVEGPLKVDAQFARE